MCQVTALSGSEVRTRIRPMIRELLQEDPTAQQLIGLVEQGKNRRFWMDDGLLLTRGNRLYVPKSGDLRRVVIRECHSTYWAGHPGEDRTTALVQQGYYWPQMRDDIADFVKTCLICQQDKADRLTLTTAACA